jgi:hypothetical protein
MSEATKSFAPKPVERAQAVPRSQVMLPPAPVARLRLAQRSVGNQAVLRSIGSGNTVEVGAPFSTLETDADAKATGALSAASADATPSDSGSTESGAHAALLPRGERGTAIDPSTRAFFEPRFGDDFSDVRVHTSPAASRAARALGARAYTSGTHIVFDNEAYSPSTDDGRRLLAHELAHVVQQHDGAVPSSLVQRQPAPTFPVAALPPQAPAVKPLAGTDPGMQADEQLYFEAEHRGELEPIRVPRLMSSRHIHIKTPAGAEADVVINGATDFPQGIDTSMAPSQALPLPGHAELAYTLIGRTPDGTPVLIYGTGDNPNASLLDVAAAGPRFVHFGLTPAEEYQAIVSAMQDATPTTVWKESQEKAAEKPYPSQEEFSRLTRDEKSDLFSERFWDELLKELTPGKIALGILAAIGMLIAGAAAVATAALLPEILFFGGAAVALAFLIYTLIADLVDRIDKGEWAQAIVGFFKNVALIVALLAGTLAVAALIVGGIVGAVLAPELAVIALVAVGVALVLMGVLILLDRNQAINSDSADRFERGVKQAARSGAEIVQTIIMTVVNGVGGRFIIGPLGFGPRGGTPPIVERPPIEIKPPIIDQAPPPPDLKPPVVDTPPVSQSQPPVSETPPASETKPPVIDQTPAVPDVKPPASESTPVTEEPSTAEPAPEEPVEAEKRPQEAAPEEEEEQAPVEKKTAPRRRIVMPSPKVVKAPRPPDVWVNTETGVYHLPDSPYYGNTKFGKTMQLAEAERLGYRLAGTPRAQVLATRAAQARADLESGQGSRSANLERMSLAESQLAWHGTDTPELFARHQQSFDALADIMDAKAAQLAASGKSDLLPTVNREVLKTPVDEFARTRLGAEWNALSEADRTKFLGEIGGREVGARVPDIVEFFLGERQIRMIDITEDVLGPLHRFKSDFYKAVMQEICGSNGPQVWTQDINPARPLLGSTPR